MQKKWTALTLTVLLVLSTMTVAYGNWYEESLDALKAVNVYQDSIDPQAKVSLGEFARLLAQSATYEHGEDPVKILQKQGFLLGDTDYTASLPLTRGAAVQIIMRGLGYYEIDYMAQALENGIIAGYPGGETYEDHIITVAEAGKLIANYKAKIKTNANPAPLVPLEDFFRLPETMGYSMTRDGKGLIFAGIWEGRINLFVVNMEDGSVEQVTYLSDKEVDRDLYTYFLKDTTLLYMRDFGGDENFHLYKTGADGKEVDLTPYPDTKVMVLDLLSEPSVPGEILIMMNVDNKEIFSIYRLNVETGVIEKILDNDMGFTGFMTDNEGKVRIASFSDGVISGYFYRETEEDEFEMIAMYDYHEGVNILMFTEDNKTAYALSNIGRDKTALIRMDVATGEELEVIEQNDEVDISGISPGRKIGTLGAVYYYTDKNNVIFYDQDIEALYRRAQVALNTTDEINLGSISEDYSKALISTSSDRDRGAVYYFDAEAMELTPLADLNTVDTDHLAPMIPVSYTARDGLVIHGYLTLPLNVDPVNLPVIVNPHGGPWARDAWGYNPEVQFLANRGYAVLQINFRGSTGYGREFLEAGYKQWGLDMQNDITDGVEWLKAIGVADPDRIGIYGASYGGYATLAGVAFTPDLYAAAVDYVGVSNLFTFLETIPPYWESMRAMFYEMVGNPETDKEQLEATSPSLHADKIKTPLFVAQGANDPRVNKAESDQMVEALRANGVEVEYMVKDNEGHGFANYDNQIDFYTQMEAFFAEHLGK